MLISHLPQFFDYLADHYNNLHQRYIGRLVELFPSFQKTDNNLFIVHDAADKPAEDDQVMKLWRDFVAAY